MLQESNARAAFFAGQHRRVTLTGRRARRGIVGALSGGIAAVAAFTVLRGSFPAAVPEALFALVGTGALLYLGLAALSARPGPIAANLAACAGIFTWAVAAPDAAWALPVGLGAHSLAFAYNARAAGRRVLAVNVAPLAGLSAAALALALLTLSLHR